MSDNKLWAMQSELSGKIQSLSNWVSILDSTALETVYGLLLVNRVKDTCGIWRQFTDDVEDIRQLAGKIRLAAGDPSNAR